jgi:hypothetical protein
VNLIEIEAIVETECAHFWMIASPSGPYSRGECKHCGEEREFRNSLPLTRWDAATEKAKSAAVSGVSPKV